AGKFWKSAFRWAMSSRTTRSLTSAGPGLFCASLPTRSSTRYCAFKALTCSTAGATRFQTQPASRWLKSSRFSRRLPPEAVTWLGGKDPELGTRNSETGTKSSPQPPRLRQPPRQVDAVADPEQEQADPRADFHAAHGFFRESAVPQRGSPSQPKKPEPDSSRYSGNAETLARVIGLDPAVRDKIGAQHNPAE